MFRSRFLFLLGALFLFDACKEVYDPSLESPVLNYLVVEGFINTKGSTVIQLTRTQKLAEKGLTKFELKAAVQIESDDNATYPVAESGPGVYRSASLNLPADRKYRLRIKTAAGKEYLSEFTPVRTTPKPAVTWDQRADGVRIYVSTADPNNQTLYYKFDYEETWEIRSTEFSFYETVQTRPNVSIAQRTPAEQINALICWKSTFSNSIFTTSTVTLAKDIVDKFQLVHIPSGTERIERRYSILVKQYALTREAYEFFELMKKNTQLLGSVFDPQPTAVRGNVMAVTDPSEAVIGYIVAASAEEHRLFITSAEANDWKYEMSCDPKFVAAKTDSLNLYFRDDRYLIKNSLYDDTKYPPMLIGYFAGLPQCLDCRKRGGNNIKPSYW